MEMYREFGSVAKITTRSVSEGFRHESPDPSLTLRVVKCRFYFQTKGQNWCVTRRFTNPTLLAIGES